MRAPSSSLRSVLTFAALSVVLLWTSAAQAASRVDINTADAATLARELIGIGESRARAIVEHRRRHGPFRSVDELALVRGIGPKTVERNRPRITLPAASSSGNGAIATGAGPARVLRRAPRPGSAADDDTPPEILVGE